MLTLIAYTKYVREHSWRWYAAALVAFALGLLSKPMVITLPCVLILLDFWPLGRGKLFFVEKIPFFALSAGSAFATVAAQSAGGAMASMDAMSLGLRVTNAIVAYVRYVGHFVLPIDLAAFYPLMRPWPVIAVAGAVVALLAVTALALQQSKRRPWLGVGWLWFLGTLVPVIGLVQVGRQAMADRYMYLPLCGLAVAITWTAAEWMNRRTATIAAALILAGCMAITMLDARGWRDSETLFTRAIDRTEPNVFALHNLSSALLLRGDTAGAIEKLEHCIKLQPNNHHARRALGYAYRAAGRLDDAKKQLTTALRIDQTDSRSWNAMGHVYFDLKNWDAAADHFAAACELNGEDYDSRMNLATARHNMGQNDLALADLREAARLNARSPDPSYLTGLLLLEMNKPQEAIESLTRATQLDPNHADAHYRLGLALMHCGQSEPATAELMRAAELSPQLRQIILSKTE
jgi:tetratricopeptide (TPR) repeat protein